ncbi:hypothetical protein ANCDUO_03685 [Ancylostoma duodenale]|uniref:Uncharacterized protein n=1 Tax=Ancylostoma duodenale TaxID=51022 RepID=A0A0C2H8W9_9BILA|nr:hypothetical protein ANCDUO_03685 [Ancylostoma duodenale]
MTGIMEEILRIQEHQHINGYCRVESLARNILEGYRRVRPLPLCTDLLTAMKARLSCSLIYGLRKAADHIKNRRLGKRRKS